jgi:2-oxoglutarate ferredoxin oxidoreductase subunit beta
VTTNLTQAEPTSHAEAPLQPLTRRDFQSAQEIRWCPGCGDFSILATVQKVMAKLGTPRHQVAVVSGIGCSSRFPYYVETYGFHSIHGRAPALATGLKCANPDLTVWVVTGDGDGLSIGTNHLIHCLRRNVNVNILLFNNRIYGLTKGQYSPTSELGKRTKSSPLGTIERPIWPVRTALAAQATFVARTMDAEPAHMEKTLEAAAQHPGTSFVEILQNCRVFNDGAFKFLKDASQKDETRVFVEHGQPIRFGSGGRKGLKIKNMEPVVVHLDSEGVSSEETLVHNARATSPALAELLAALVPPEFPMALGVFRDVQRPTYEEALMEQVNQAKNRRGDSGLQGLLNGGTTWEVE